MLTVSIAFAGLASYGSDSEDDRSPVASTSALPPAQPGETPTRPSSSVHRLTLIHCAAALTSAPPAQINRLRPPASSTSAPPSKPNSPLAGVRLSTQTSTTNSPGQAAPYQAPRAKSKSPPPYVRSPAPPEPRALPGSQAQVDGQAGAGEGLSIRGAAERGGEDGRVGGGGGYGLKVGSLSEFGVPPVPRNVDEVAPSVQVSSDYLDGQLGSITGVFTFR